MVLQKMMTHDLCLVFTALILSATVVGQKNNLLINPSIKEKAIAVIRPSAYSKTNDRILTYNNLMQAETFVNDTLISTVTKNRMDIFKSYYYWNKGTLIIEGGFVLWSNYGFSAKLVKNKVFISQLVRSDEYRLDNYKAGKDKIRNEIQCKSSKLILEKKPNKSANARIYGYIEFEGGDHFAIMDNRPLNEKNAFRDNLKIYFKADKLP